MTTTQDKLNTFFKQFPTSTFQKRDVIISSVETTPFFYFIESGAVKMSHTTADGKTIVLHIFFPHTFFSLLSLIDEVNTYDFEALVPTVVRKVPRTQLITFLEENADVSFDLNKRLLRGMKGLLHRIENSSTIPAIDQIKSILLYYASHFGEAQKGNSQTLSVKLTHQEIADWLGLTRENVSLQMKSLEEAKLIESDNRFIRILNIKKLEN